MKKNSASRTLLKIMSDFGIALLITVLHPLAGMAQNENYWLKTCDSADNCGYVDAQGNVKIALGKYPVCFTDTMYNYAIVYTPQAVLIAINRNEQELFKVFTVDNGPDYIREGLFRIVKNHKTGFANTKGEIVINPQFEYVTPFNNGLAAFCKKCRFIKEGEHTSVSGGLWGFVNKKGAIVYKAGYKRIEGDGLKKTVYKKNGILYIEKDNKLQEVTKSK